MGNNNLKGGNEILIKVDQNNLIYIDPNSVLVNGQAQPREIQPENLVMYANLEADLVPRSILVDNSDKNSLTSIAGGTVSFFRNKDGGDYDTKWTDVYTSSPPSVELVNTGNPYFPIMPIVKNAYKNDTTAQSFGIDSISVQVTGANFIPRVVIKFIDVRGKTLFESPENSPYAAFFHLPWPIFYLTIKGYFGKAIKYRLHLVKFNSRFNSGTGNFEIETNFVGSTYAYLADISLQSVMNAPYFYLSENDTKTKFNQDTQFYDVTISKSTKGYRILKSVYQEYMNKGLLPPNFPIRTLRELIVIAGRLNKILETEIFAKVISTDTLSGVKSFEDQLSQFQGNLNGWRSKHLTNQIVTDGTTQLNPDGTTSEIQWYKLKPTEKDLQYVTGTGTDSLISMINNNIKKLDENQTFGIGANKKGIDNGKIKITAISFNTLKDIKKYYRPKDGTYVIDFDGLLDDFYECYKNFTEQRVKLESDIEKEMNNIVKNPDMTKGLGFEPTIRNIIGVILANAETYIRLMRDVHNRAFEKGSERKKLLNNVITDSKNPADAIYPWPEIKVATAGGKELVLKYPGGRDMDTKLKAYNKSLWPEVDFVENFYEIATKKADNLNNDGTNPENINYIFDTTSTATKRDIGVLTTISNYLPYADKSMSTILYEIYERAKYNTTLNPFDDASITELANVEFENLKEQVVDDTDIVDLLRDNIKNVNNLYSYMAGLSPYERFPYFQDQLPTIPYIKDDLSSDFSIQKITKVMSKGDTSEYAKLSEFLMNYQPESYRVDTYPFNSSTYLVYNKFTERSLFLNKILNVNPPQDFISSPQYPSMWVKEGYKENMFDYQLLFGDTYKHILNTPYFHKQLFDDFSKVQPQEKYVGSAYLLLNSLPFKDLDDTISGTEIPDEISTMPADSSVLVSTIFREVAATHYIPYHMMLKWGSIYHRYKKWITDGVDIIAGVTDPIDGSLFFDNNNGRTYSTVFSKTVDRSTESDVGIHPYYDSIFHQIVNGYSFFNHTTGPSSYTDAITNGTLIEHFREANEANTYVSFVDNSKFYSTATGYTLLPSNGYNDIDISSDEFLKVEQENFRILWNVGTTGKTTPIYSGYTFPSTYEYLKLTGSTDTYSLSTNYRKVIDLIATFKPDILDVFEYAFLEFSSERLNEEISFSPYNVRYSNFQDLLKRMVYIPKNVNDSDNIEQLLKTVKDRQVDELKTLTQDIIGYDNQIRISMANPREIDNYILGGFTGVDVRNFDVNTYYTPNPDLIELYLGKDMDGYYHDFFIVNNIDESEENIKAFRFLVYMYAGLRAAGISYSNLTKEFFVGYLKSNVISAPRNSVGVSGMDGRLNRFLEQLITNIQSIQKLDTQTPGESVNKTRGYNDDIIKLELYNYFKSFNDKWTSGNSIGQRSLLEEFLFLDKANRDIGDKVYIDMEKLTKLSEKGNEKINLFSAIALLVQDTGFDIRALPSYVNFYGTNFSSSAKITPSKNVAKNIFGTFLDVDTENSSPRIILQYIGPSSKHPEMSDVDPQYRKNRYANDGFNVGNTNNNPVLVTSDVFAHTDYSKSNKVVAFEVSFGDQNQSIFKGIELDQATIKNTTESMIVTERLGRSETGSSTAQVDIGLFDIYRQASYTCTVTCMGNVIIQPTMYFYLKNVPMFRGSYWITEVTHNIKTSGIETTFKGVRIPAQSLPDPTDSFLASYRPFFDKLIQSAKVKVQSALATENKSKTEKTISLKSGESVMYDPGIKSVSGEKFLQKPGITSYGVPYDGYLGEHYVQSIEYTGAPAIVPFNNVWLRAIAVTMGGPNHPLDDSIQMSLLSRNKTTGFGAQQTVTWGEIKNTQVSLLTPITADFYVTKFNLKSVDSDTILSYETTMFLNPNYNKDVVTVETTQNYTTKIFTGPISVGPSVSSSVSSTLGGTPGIALSLSLMNRLKLKDGDIIYFKMFK